MMSLRKAAWLLAVRNHHPRLRPFGEYRAAHICSCTCHQRKPHKVIPAPTMQASYQNRRFSVPIPAHLGRLIHTNLPDCAKTTTLCVQNGILRDYLSNLVSEYEASQQTLLTGVGGGHRNSEELRGMQPAAERMRMYMDAENEIEELNIMIRDAGDGDDLAKMAEQDIAQLQLKMTHLEEELISLLVPPERADHNDVVLEVSAGVGGQEAMLFAMDLWDLYATYATMKGWSFQVITYEDTELGGCRRASAEISGEDVYRNLKYESGVHRVQRVPKTEKSGRMHTSTVTVAVMPQPSEIEVVLSPKDLRIDTFRAGGKGGQHVNKTDSAVRITHLPSGMVAECQENRSQIKNRELALQILRTKMYQKELDAQIKQEYSQRKLQVGTAARSEKVRTYNFQQDRITDHRIGLNLHDLDSFFASGEPLQGIIDGLAEEAGYERLLELLEKYRQEKR